MGNSLSACNLCFTRVRCRTGRSHGPLITLRRRADDVSRSHQNELSGVSEKDVSMLMESDGVATESAGSGTSRASRRRPSVNPRALRRLSNQSLPSGGNNSPHNDDDDEEHQLEAAGESRNRLVLSRVNTLRPLLNQLIKITTPSSSRPQSVLLRLNKLGTNLSWGVQEPGTTAADGRLRSVAGNVSVAAVESVAPSVKNPKNLELTVLDGVVPRTYVLHFSTKQSCKDWESNFDRLRKLTTVV